MCSSNRHARVDIVSYGVASPRASRTRPAIDPCQRSALRLPVQYNQGCNGDKRPRSLPAPFQRRWGAEVLKLVTDKNSRSIDETSRSECKKIVGHSQGDFLQLRSQGLFSADLSEQLLTLPLSHYFLSHPILTSLPQSPKI